MKKIETKKPNKLIIISAVILAATFIIAVAFIYKPFTEKEKSLRADILQERDRNVLVGKIRALGKHLKVYDKKIPKGVGVSWLLGEVSDMASREQIEVSSITPGSPEDYDLYVKVHVIMNVTCTYHQLGRFVSRVESSGKFLKIEGLNMKRLDLDEAFGKKATKFKASDVKANIVISTIIDKE